jgi:DNA-binding NarL/FixJ family response regulator
MITPAFGRWLAASWKPRAIWYWARQVMVAPRSPQRSRLNLSWCCWIQLPDRDGLEVARQLLQQAPHCQVVVLISSRAACDYGHHVDQCGARGFITKDELCGATLAELLLVAE